MFSRYEYEVERAGRDLEVERANHHRLVGLVARRDSVLLNGVSAAQRELGELLVRWGQGLQNAAVGRGNMSSVTG